VHFLRKLAKNGGVMKVFNSFLMVLCLSFLANAQLSGPLSGTITAGDYDVIGHISVSQGDSLVIEPGVTFYFTGPYYFNIYGYLNATGTAENNIIFRPEGNGVWHGIKFYSSDSDSCKLEYCAIVKSVNTGIYCQSSDILVKNCRIWRNLAIMDGAGIYFNDSHSIVEGCRITSNGAMNPLPYQSGGGIYCIDSEIYIIDCYIAENIVNGTGGGASFFSCTGSIENSVIHSNMSGTFGGGLYLHDSNVDIIATDVTYNTVDNQSGSIEYGNGGGICAKGVATMLIDQCDISYNSCNAEGGGISFDHGPGVPEFVLSNSRICNNTMWHIQSRGGGVYVDWNNFFEIHNCLVAGNGCSVLGGGLFLYGTGVVTNCTVVNNAAWWNGQGGGILFFNTYGIDVDNTIIANNTAVTQVYFYEAFTGSISYCDVYDRSGTFFGGYVPANLGTITTVNANGDPCDDFYNIFEPPSFYSTAGDSAYYLNADSPCIDAGDPLTPLDPDSTVADIGTYYYDQGGLWGDKAEMLDLPVQVNLIEAYPNPFNPTTVLSYELRVASRVNLGVYDLAGRRVATLVNGFRDAGNHEITFDGSDLPSGIYFYRIQASNWSDSGKMVLVK